MANIVLSWVPLVSQTTPYLLPFSAAAITGRAKSTLSPAAPKLRAPPSADEVAHSRRPSMPLPMAAPKLARAALSKLSHGRSRLSRRVSPAAPSSMLLLRADELAHGLRPSPLPPGSTESRLALDELAHGRRRQSRRARKRSDSLRPWPRPSAREEEDAEPLARAVL